MVHQSLNKRLWCETHQAPRPLVLVYSLPLLAILDYGASVTEQIPLVRDSPSAEYSLLILSYGASVTEQTPLV